MIYVMENAVQHYHWGTKDFIPSLLGVKNVDSVPYAELWMGAHPNGSSSIAIEGKPISLLEYFNRNREIVLSEKIWNEFGQLPFLFKVLSIDSPLSIQVHPTITQAKNGYKRENEEGIPLDSPQRNYKDQNHKPEMVYALSDFWLLKGFRPFDEAMDLFHFAPNFLLEKMRDIIKNSNDPWRIFFSWFMNLDNNEEELLLDSIGKLSDDSNICKWIKKLADQYPGDISAFAPVYMNLIHLTPGESLFQPGGELHAYLSGNAIEIMANSNNVLRGGLTSKHMDIPELLKVLNFNPSNIDIIPKGSSDLSVDIKDFQLSIFRNKTPLELELDGMPTILFNLSDKMKITDQDGKMLIVQKGQSLWIDASFDKYHIETEKGYIFIAKPGVIG